MACSGGYAWRTFKAFEAWEELYEPENRPETKQHDGSYVGQVLNASGANQAMEYAQEQARAALLAQIHSGVLNTCMRTLLEYASKLLTPVEETIQEKSSANLDAALVLNALNGVLLTYRFEHHDPKQANTLVPLVPLLLSCMLMRDSVSLSICVS